MNLEEQKYFYETLYELADTVIHLEEINLEDVKKKEIFETTIKNVDNFIEKVDSKISLCKDKNEIEFVANTTINFLIFSLKKLLVGFDCPDENIEYIAEHIKDQILSLKRKQS